MCRGGLFCSKSDCSDYGGGDVVISEDEQPSGVDEYYEMLSCCNTTDEVPQAHKIYIMRAVTWDEIEDQISVVACGGCEYKVYECSAKTGEVKFLTKSSNKLKSKLKEESPESECEKRKSFLLSKEKEVQ